MHANNVNPKLTNIISLDCVDVSGSIFVIKYMSSIANEKDAMEEIPPIMRPATAMLSLPHKNGFFDDIF